ncbi:uncharacterized protein LOC101167351 isoform X2 [Oryzias latipes]|uniref:uncharacterized protein LOC101167351 isoform X2 n=1 Tax=Oryzias latipes TaxID=8090 RepID=UPI0005CB8856|nr:uncharacterized protein LOC101167351 isoform X2 [Oryzias latipes]
MMESGTKKETRVDQLPVRQLEEEEDVYSTDRSGWSSSSSSYRDPCEESPDDVSQRLIIPERSPAGPTRDLQRQVEILQQQLTESRTENKLLKEDLEIQRMELQYYQDENVHLIKQAEDGDQNFEKVA